MHIAYHKIYDFNVINVYVIYFIEFKIGNWTQMYTKWNY